MQKKILAAALAVAGLSFSTVSLAGPGGTAGPTSSLDSRVTLTINGAVRISQVADIPLGVFDPMVVMPMVGTSEACVGRAGGPNYTVTVSSVNGAFQLRDPLAVAPATPIPYSVAWRVGATAYTTLGYNTASAAYAADTNDLSVPCVAGDSKLQVTVPYAGMNASQAGNYEDTLTVLVAPI